MYAKRLGATQCGLHLGCDKGLQTRVRMGSLEQLEHHDSHSGSVVVYRGKAKASVRTNQLDTQSLQAAIRTAYDAAGHAETDDCAGLANPDRWAQEFQDFDCYHPHDLTAAEALDMAHRCEMTALGCDTRLVNSEGAECSGSHSLDCLALFSHDSAKLFNRVEPGSSFSLGCVVIGQGKTQQQVGYWFDHGNDIAQLNSPHTIGEKAAQLTLEKLDARSTQSGNFPVLFDAQMARGFWQMLVAALQGGALYRKASVLCDKLNTTLFPSWLSIEEQPHCRGYPGSSNFDAEGVATYAKNLVKDGVLASYLLDSYSARKLGMSSTANAGGISNLCITGPTQSAQSLIGTMGTGLLVRDTMGSGLNMVTGDFSVGASGLWVENGAIAYPVQEVTISGNILEMFANVAAVGDDVDPRYAVRTGSVLLSSMCLGGSG